MKQQLHFMIGLPRSGSTVLSALLNQAHDVYVTPTSPLLGYILNAQESYYKIEESIANPDFDQLTRICKSIIEAAWSNKSETHIIDKHRGWGKNLNAIKTVTGRDVKVIATVRDLPSIMASWLTLIKKYPYEFDKKLWRQGLTPTDENRMGEMWFNMTKDTMESVCMAKQTTDKSNLLFVDYDDFMNSPLEQLRRIENFIGVDHYEKYDFDNIQKLEKDDDFKAWGLPDLHKIRPKIGKNSKNAVEVLGEDLYNRFVKIEKQYDYR